MSEMIVVDGGSTALTAHRAATDAASVCKEIVTRTAQSIQGRKYVRVEGWQSIANAFGCVASAVDVEKVEGGIRAVGQVRRVADGTLIATAEGFVGDDEKTWSSRNEFARRAMAQTRAISRACRSAFAFVVTMMDAGLETTPAEEMGDFHEKPQIEYRPKPSPENLERRAKAPAPKPADSAFVNAVTAIGNANSIGKCEGIRAKLDTSLASGRLTEVEFKDALQLLQAKAGEIIAAEEAAQ